MLFIITVLISLIEEIDIKMYTFHSDITLRGLNGSFSFFNFRQIVKRSSSFPTLVFDTTTTGKLTIVIVIVIVIVTFIAPFFFVRQTQRR
jgi:hypothetical protein